MRLAVAGTHATGKTTLVEALASRWPGYTAIEESFYDQGPTTGALTVDSLEAQLSDALGLLEQPGFTRAIFDRSPVDYLAYLHCLDQDHDLTPWLEPVKAALVSLDLIVFVPIDTPDRIALGSGEYPKLRKGVDRLLRAVLLENAWGLGSTALEVTGPVEARVRQIEEYLSGDQRLPSR